MCKPLAVEVERLSLALEDRPVRAFAHSSSCETASFLAEQMPNLFATPLRDSVLLPEQEHGIHGMVLALLVGGC
jgi:hypothetical protein